MTEAINYSSTKIQKSLNDFTEAWNNYDATSIAQTFTEDAELTNIIGQNFNGRTSIQAQHAFIFSTIFKASNMVFIKTKTKFLDYNIAAVDIYWNLSKTEDFNGNSIPMRKGLMNVIMKRQNDDWLISIMHNMEIPVFAFDQLNLS